MSAQPPSSASVEAPRDADLVLAHDLADIADTIAMSRFHAADLVVATKPDMTPVTDADRAVEQAIRDELASRRPGDAVLGEEFGGLPPSSDEQARTWVVDPIDGTKSFVRGVPVWASLIAVLSGHTVTAAVVSAPALGRRWWAAAGHGSWVSEPGRSGRRCRVSGVERLDEASISYASLSGWHGVGRTAAFLGLLGDAWRTRAYGDFWSYMLVAEGAVDACAEPELALHDMAAPSLIVSEAGGQFTSLQGEPGPYGGNAAATNGLLHPAVLARLG